MKTRGRKAGLAMLAPAVAALTFGVLPAHAVTTTRTGTGTTTGTTTGKSAKVVSVADRSPIGKMLVNDKALSLYILSTGSCTGQCLSIWPPLLMPTGKTIPTGAKCLSTVAGPTKGTREVTYDGKRLYTFIEDSGTSVSGNGVNGFEAAKVLASCR